MGPSLFSDFSRGFVTWPVWQSPVGGQGRDRVPAERPWPRHTQASRAPVEAAAAALSAGGSYHGAHAWGAGPIPNAGHAGVPDGGFPLITDVSASLFLSLRSIKTQFKKEREKRAHATSNHPGGEGEKFCADTHRRGEKHSAGLEFIAEWPGTPQPINHLFKCETTSRGSL